MQNIPVSVDFSKTPIAFPHFFNAFGYANCDYTYTRPTKKLYRHLASIGRDFYYMRLHNILTAHGETCTCSHKAEITETPTPTPAAGRTRCFHSKTASSAATGSMWTKFMTSFSQAAESRLLRRILFLPAYRATRNIPKDFNP